MTDHSALIERLDPTDDQIVTALRDGGRTAHVADRLGMLIRRPYILRRMRRLERAGRVARSDRYTSANDIYWLPIPSAPNQAKEAGEC